MREAVEQRVKSDTPAQRWADPQEIGEVLLLSTYVSITQKCWHVYYWVWGHVGMLSDGESMLDAGCSISMLRQGGVPNWCGHSSGRRAAPWQAAVI